MTTSAPSSQLPQLTTELQKEMCYYWVWGNTNVRPQQGERSRVTKNQLKTWNIRLLCHMKTLIRTSLTAGFLLGCIINHVRTVLQTNLLLNEFIFQRWQLPKCKISEWIQLQKKNHLSIKHLPRNLASARRCSSWWHAASTSWRKVLCL